MILYETLLLINKDENTKKKNIPQKQLNKTEDSEVGKGRVIKRKILSNALDSFSQTIKREF